MRRVYIFLFSVNYLFCTAIYAQEVKDTLHISVVEITAARGKIFSAGNKITEPDSITKANYITADLSELLRENSSAFIKSYGIGGIATISFRGTEARHTSILWNGFNINSATLGLSDLALVPVNFADKITIVHGSESALYGTSAIGGVIDLQNVPDFFNGLKLNYTGSIGSFGTFENVFRADAGINNILSTTRLFYEQSKNNFPYTDFFQKDQKEQHADVNNFGVLQNFYFRLNNSTVISSGVWYQITNREIPPLITVPESYAEQKDSVLRTFVEFEKVFRKSSLNLRAAYFNEYELYMDSFYKIYAPYKITSYKTEAEYRVKVWNNLILNTGSSFNNYKAEVNEYNNEVHKNYFAAFAGLRYDFKNDLYITADIRKEFATNQTTPVSPSAGVEKMFFKNLITTKLKVGKNFNLPTLNDLYWVPGGNIELKPETGWSYEGGVSLQPFRKNNFSIEATYFSTLINDWIQWQPTAFGYYAPQNLKQVHARGIESSVKYNLKLKEFELSFSGNYSFTKSTNEKSSQVSGEEVIGKQLIYIPGHLANFNLRLSFKNFSFSYTQQFTGMRFTTSDNSSSLPFYQVANIRLEKNFLAGKNKFVLFIKINNLFNEIYNAIAYRPMPGRNYSAGITIHLNFIKPTIYEKN